MRKIPLGRQASFFIIAEKKIVLKIKVMFQFQNSEPVKFTAENITSTYIKGLGMANTLGLGISSKLDGLLPTRSQAR